MALIGIAVVVLIWLAGKVGETEKAVLTVLSEKSDLQVRDVRFTEVGDSGMKWELTADTARYRKRDQRVIFEKVIVRLVRKDGATFMLTGDRGTLNTDTRDLLIEGHVVIVSEKGDRFTTRSLRYRNAERIIETDDPVQMESGPIRVDGVGMIYNLDDNKVQLLSGVRARSGQ